MSGLPPEHSALDAQLERHWLLAQLAVLACGLAMVTWGWGTWADPLIDFGREAYAAWRQAEGDLLYRDVAWFNGPLSVYFNGMLFRVAGPGLWVLFTVNALIAAGIILGMMHLLRRAWSPSAAVLGGLVFCGIFGFSTYLRYRNYNYIAPYSHELTHGIALSVLALILAQHALETDRARHLFAAGLAVGLTALTKIEAIVAISGAMAVTAVGWCATGHRCRGLLWGLAGAAVPLAAGWLILAWEGGWQHGARAWSALWLPRHSSVAISQRYFLLITGLDDPAARIMAIGRVALAYAAAVAAAATLAVLLRKAPKWGIQAVGIAVAAVVAGSLLLFDWRKVPWEIAALPWQVFIAGAFGWRLVALWRTRSTLTRPELCRDLLRLTMITWAGLLLLKVILWVRFAHYGFALAMPATLVLVAVAWQELPRLAGRGAPIFRGLVLGGVAALVVGHMLVFALNLRVLDETMAAGRDSLRGDPRLKLMAETVDVIATHAALTDTVAVMPDGAMINYLARRKAPTPYLHLLPPELAVFGPETITSAVLESTPEWVVLIDRDTSEYGPRRFGYDYFQTIGSWIDTYYEPFALIGEPPMRDQGFGLLIFKRRATPASSSPGSGSSAVFP